MSTLVERLTVGNWAPFDPTGYWIFSNGGPPVAVPACLVSSLPCDDPIAGWPRRRSGSEGGYT